MRRIDLERMANHQPVKDHAQRGQVLFDRRLGQLALQFLDIGGDVQRLHIAQARQSPALAEAAPLAPVGKAARGLVIGAARILVADIGGEEAEEALGGFRIGEEQRRELRAQPRERARLFVGDDFSAHSRPS
jgi:hypothetical protein